MTTMQSTRHYRAQRRIAMIDKTLSVLDVMAHAVLYTLLTVLLLVPAATLAFEVL